MNEQNNIIRKISLNGLEYSFGTNEDINIIIEPLNNQITGLVTRVDNLEASNGQLNNQIADLIYKFNKYQEYIDTYYQRISNMPNITFEQYLSMFEPIEEEATPR